MKRKPNCFILGAPKCGSTSLAMYLADHPNVFMCDPKEPNFWAPEIAKDDALPGYYGTTLDDYLSLFAGASDAQRVIVDASTSYIWSESAVASIHGFDPQAKYIVLLRDPTDLTFSLHQEELYAFNEPVPDFETAWKLQDERLRGRQLPPGLTSPMKLQYRRIASLGTHLERALSIIPRERLLILFLDDMRTDPLGMYRRTLEFLGLPYLGKSDFEVFNKAKEHRFPLMMKLLWQPTGPVATAMNGAKKVAIGLGLKGLRSGVVKRLTKERQSASMPAELQERLKNDFEIEVEKIESITGRELASWKPAAVLQPS